MRLRQMPNGNVAFGLEQNAPAMRDLNTYVEYECNVPSH